MWFLLFLAFSTSTGISTIFGQVGDKWAGGTTRCLRDEHGKKRAVDPDLETGDVGIAHRSLKCGAIVKLTNHETGITISAVVVDAGPYGAVSYDPEGGKKIWYVKRTRDAKPSKKDCPSQRCKAGPWRGILDLTPRAAHLLGHDGWAWTTLVYDRRDLRWQKRYSS